MRHGGGSAGDDHAHRARIDIAGGERRIGADEQAKAGNHRLDRGAGGFTRQRIVNGNAIAIAQVHRFEPASQAALFRARQAAGASGDIERKALLFHDRLVDAFHRPVLLVGRAASHGQPKRQHKRGAGGAAGASGGGSGGGGPGC